MKNQYFQLLTVQLKEFFREPGILFWALLFPVLMAGGLGLAFTQKGELTQPVALVFEQPWDSLQNTLEPNGPNAWIKRIGNEKMGYTRYTFSHASWEDAIVMLKKGKVDLIIRRVHDSTEYHFDPLNPE